MGVITDLVRRALPLEGPYPLTAARLIDAMGGRHSEYTGKAVTPEGALGIAAVYACVRVLTDSVGQLPIPVYRRLERGKTRATEHPLYTLLHDAPNPWMTPSTFKQTVMGHVLLWGNSYTNVEWDPSGRIVGLWPLRPPDVVKITPAADGSLLYEYRVPRTGEVRQIPQREMLHIRGLSPDGIRGYSPITLHRESLGLTMAAEEFGARFFGNSANPSGVLQTKARLTQPAADRLKESWTAAHQGLTNAHRIAVLEEGVEWKQMSLPPNDAQFLETRQFQLTEASRIFRVPPHKISDLNRATYSNVDKQEQQFKNDSLGPWLVSIEEQMNLSLLTPAERRTYFAEFLMDAQWRSDILTRYTAYAMGRQWGFLSANDVRELENLNPITGGDDYWQPVNMGIVGAMPAAGVGADGSNAAALPADASPRMVLDALMRDAQALIAKNAGASDEPDEDWTPLAIAAPRPSKRSIELTRTDGGYRLTEE